VEHSGKLVHCLELHITSNFMGRPSGLLSLAPHDGSCGALAWLGDF
jgi:hypothetical protein